jgi:hypothetical protein
MSESYSFARKALVFGLRRISPSDLMLKTALPERLLSEEALLTIMFFPSLEETA